MTTVDLVFASLALVAVAAALVAARSAVRRRAAAAGLVAAGAEAALVASFGAWIVAALETAAIGAGIVVLRRTSGSAGDEDRDAAPFAAGPFPWRAALLVVAFVVMVVRVVLMVRWPNIAPGAASAPSSPTATGPAHHLLVQSVVFGVGWFAAATRRGPEGIAIGLATMLLSAAGAIVATGHFTGSTAEAGTLAAVVVLAGVAAGAALLRIGPGEILPPARPDLPSPSGTDCGDVSSGLLAAIAGCALALLVGAW